MAPVTLRKLHAPCRPFLTGALLISTHSVSWPWVVGTARSAHRNAQAVGWIAMVIVVTQSHSRLYRRTPALGPALKQDGVSPLLPLAASASRKTQYPLLNSQA